MSDKRLEEIRAKIKTEEAPVVSTVTAEQIGTIEGVDYSDVNSDDLLWLIKRVEELEKENEWLRMALRSPTVYPYWIND